MDIAFSEICSRAQVSPTPEKYKMKNNRQIIHKLQVKIPKYSIRTQSFNLCLIVVYSWKFQIHWQWIENFTGKFMQSWMFILDHHNLLPWGILFLLHNWFWFWGTLLGVGLEELRGEALQRIRMLEKLQNIY